MHTAPRREDARDATLRLLLAGPFPEPVGGVSIHIRRLCSWLSAQGVAVDLIDEARHRKTDIYNIRSARFLSYLRRAARCNVAHIHSSVHLFRMLHILVCRLLGLRVVVTIHSWRPGGPVAWASRLFLKWAHKVIVVSEEIDGYLRLRNCQVIPAFLPPVDCRQALPDEVTAFLSRSRARGDRLLCANAYEMVENLGQDLYGLDLCVELMNRLTDRPDVKVAFVYVVSCDAQRNKLYTNAQRLIREGNLEDRFCLYNKPVDFVTLMRRCDLVLRPTNTDGDAVTIREGLYLGLPVIASDVVRRPAGTVLFRNRDVADLTCRTVDVLTNWSCHTCTPVQADGDTYFMKYLDLYREMLTSRPSARRRGAPDGQPKP